MKTQDVSADGNCFFRAISNFCLNKYVKESNEQTKLIKKLKKVIISYIIKNVDEIREFMPYKNIYEYEEKLMKNGFWGSAFEANILSQALKFNIIIFSEAMNFPVKYGNFKKNCFIYHTGSHYKNITNIDVCDKCQKIRKTLIE